MNSRLSGMGRASRAKYPSRRIRFSCLRVRFWAPAWLAPFW